MCTDRQLFDVHSTARFRRLENKPTENEMKNIGTFGNVKGPTKKTNTVKLGNKELFGHPKIVP